MRSLRICYLENKKLHVYNISFCNRKRWLQHFDTFKKNVGDRSPKSIPSVTSHRPPLRRRHFRPSHCCHATLSRLTAAAVSPPCLPAVVPCHHTTALLRCCRHATPSLCHAATVPHHYHVILLPCLTTSCHATQGKVNFFFHVIVVD